MPKSALARRIEALEKFYGPPRGPVSSDPFALILWENVSYLVDDEKRAKAFGELKKRVGLRPSDILGASSVTLHAIASAGIKAELKVEAIRASAEVAMAHSGGDLRKVLALPAKEALRVLRKFPSIGEPGAEKILLFCRAQRIFALESNGLRALVRLGYGEEKKSYSATYRAVRESVAGEIVDDFDWLIRAHLLLKQHGQETCRRSAPSCETCPLHDGCAFVGRGDRG